ncbi:helix-turn-helix transcriptional regulator [Coxiella burnetii]|uniref:Transcriptional regulator, LuxR family n=1 Tax=Coxiella burnetii (strain Dugway 5J108-111) TaxID=434922 RepID=A9KFE3_COXBN|nr:helix-turn-helix transcriptional regulator [Coxiella burnetii]ABS77083.1 transcriptional regulator, LuxR family [Coxiella burnetii Dugway 5J108-111]OYK80344.1 helix-turn-helix transcriptional regulator [Coxiella burnetii]OYK82464.1 helix-turn-helix transcriptional regulator [Coxiella burnetii]
MKHLQDALYQSPDLIYSTDFAGKFTFLNKTTSSKTGFNKEVRGISKHYCDMPCKASELGEVFATQDLETIQLKKHTSWIGLAEYAGDDFTIWLGTKSPIIDNDLVIGVFCSFKNVTRSPLINLYNILQPVNITKSKPQLTLKICDYSLPVQLSKIESKVLFYLLRCYTSKEIATLLSRSFRTIEDHVENLKNKFNCNTKTQLIEYGITKGLLNIIPQCLLVRSFAS